MNNFYLIFLSKYSPYFKYIHKIQVPSIHIYQYFKPYRWLKQSQYLMALWTKPRSLLKVIKCDISFIYYIWTLEGSRLLWDLLKTFFEHGDGGIFTSICEWAFFYWMILYLKGKIWNRGNQQKRWRTTKSSCKRS